MDENERNFDKEKVSKGFRSTLMDYSQQLLSLGALQQAVVRNMRREIEKDS